MIKSIAAILSWRLAPVRTTLKGAPLLSTSRWILAPSFPLSVGFLPLFSPPSGAAQLLESIACHFHPRPLSLWRSVRPSSSSASRRCPSLSPPLEALVDDARAHPEPILMNGLPLATGPKDVPDAVDHRPIT